MWKPHIRRARLWLQALFATTVIALALGVGVAQMALPWIASHPHRIAALLSDRLQRAVTLDGVTGVWERDGPLLALHGVHIAGADAKTPGSTIPQAELKINFFSALHRNQAWNEFRLVGLNLRLARDAQGQWLLSGIDAGDQAAGNPKDSILFSLGALVLRDLRLTAQGGDGAKPIILLADELRLVNSVSTHRVLARGSGRLQFWAWWKRDHLERARLESDLTNVVLTTSAPIELDPRRSIVPRVGFDRIAFGARWQRGDSGWTADVADLVLDRQGIV